MTVFSHLSATRSAGMSINPISFLEIKQYFEFFPPPYDIEFVVNTIQRMDAFYLDFARKRAEQERQRAMRKKK